jgi:hypothetical protein
VSGSWYEHLADVWQDSKIDGLGYLNPQEIVEESMKMDSRGIESLAKKWNLGGLEQEAHGNVSNPAMGIGKASTAAGLGFLGAGFGDWISGANAYGAAVPGVSQGSQQAAMLAAQTGEFGAHGLGKTMQAASIANELPAYQAAMANMGGGLLSGGKSGAATQRYAMNQAMDMMQPQQPMQAPPQPLRYQQEPMQNPYGQQQFDPSQLTEEQKMKLRMMGYQV